MTQTALIVVDMQNSFVHPDGENYYPAVAEVIPACLSLIEAAAAGPGYLVHVREGHREGFNDFEQPRLPVHCVIGGFNHEFGDGFGPKGRPREIEIVKRRQSAFFATDLALFLREQGVTRVVLCGVKTNVCIRATASDAFAHGFEVVLAREATNSNRPHLAEASAEDIDRYLGRAVSLDEAKAMLAGDAA